MSVVKSEQRDWICHAEMFTKNDNFPSVCVIITLLVCAFWYDSTVEEDRVILTITAFILFYFIFFPDR